MGSHFPGVNAYFALHDTFGPLEVPGLQPIVYFIHYTGPYLRGLCAFFAVCNFNLSAVVIITVPDSGHIVGGVAYKPFVYIVVSGTGFTCRRNIPAVSY